MGDKVDRSLFMGTVFVGSFNKGTIRFETIRCSFQQLQQPPSAKVERTINCIAIVIRQHSQNVFFIKKYNIV